MTFSFSNYYSDWKQRLGRKRRRLRRCWFLHAPKTAFAPGRASPAAVAQESDEATDKVLFLRGKWVN